jgi:hypothetical protein
MKPRILSEFISLSLRKTPGLFFSGQTEFTKALRADITAVLGRKPVDEEKVSSAIEELYVKKETRFHSFFPVVTNLTPRHALLCANSERLDPKPAERSYYGGAYETGGVYGGGGGFGGGGGSYSQQPFRLGNRSGYSSMPLSTSSSQPFGGGYRSAAAAPGPSAGGGGGGNSGFTSALSLHRSATTTTAASPSSWSSFSSSTLRNPALKGTTAGKRGGGSGPSVPETRLSRLGGEGGTLLASGPRLKKEEEEEDTKPFSGLASFQAASSASLAAFKDLGRGEEGANKVKRERDGDEQIMRRNRSRQ